MNKKEIIDYISMIINFCIADGNTYLYAKCVPTVEQDNKKIPIGGGNFTVLLSTLATLEFLATIEVIINAGADDFYSNDDIEKISNEKKKCDDSIKKLIIVPKADSLKTGSGKRLREFLESTTNITGINKKDAGKIQSIRNKLAHEYTPKIISAAGLPFMPGIDFVNLTLQYRSRDVFCLTTENAIGIDSNALNHKLHGLLKYVIEKLESLNDESKIKKLSQYITNQK